MNKAQVLFGEWLRVTTVQSDLYGKALVPAMLVSVTDPKKAQDWIQLLHELRPLVRGRILDVERVSGWGVRVYVVKGVTAPPWQVFPTEEEALAFAGAILEGA